MQKKMTEQTVTRERGVSRVNLNLRAEVSECWVLFDCASVCLVDFNSYVLVPDSATPRKRVSEVYTVKTSCLRQENRPEDA